MKLNEDNNEHKIWIKIYISILGCVLLIGCTQKSNLNNEQDNLVKNGNSSIQSR